MNKDKPNSKTLEDQKKIIKEIRTKNDKIKEILRKCCAEEVEEFLATSMAVGSVINTLDGEVVQMSPLSSLHEAVKTFMNYLKTLEESDKLKRYLSSSHLRPKLESLNSAIDGELRVFLTEQKESEKQDSATKGTNSTPTKSRAQQAMPRIRSFSKIMDDEGRALWAQQFGAENDQVNWPTFIQGFSAALKQQYSVVVTEEDENFLRKILDNANTGCVSSYRFSEFLRGFGPVKRAVPYMRRVLNEKWFYGFLSGEESIRLLTGQPTGTFLVRFSRSRPGSFALSFVWGDGRILSVLITGCMPEGLKVKEVGDVERNFDTLYAVLDYYKPWLLIPFSGSLSKESWFHGDLTKEEAEDLLKEQKPGTFLIRFGDGPNSFYCSYVAPNHQVLHAEIQSDATGIMPQEQKGVVYATLNEYIRANRHILHYNYDPEGVPRLRIRPLDGRLIDWFHGPPDPLKPGEAYNKWGAGRSCSTYPRDVGYFNLICDRYGLTVLGNFVIICVADGCSWGPRPQEAAMKASLGFMEYVREQFPRMVDLKEVGHCLLRGFSIAHAKIIEGKTEIFEAGTTTLLGGVVLELIDADKQGEFKYAFICASVGDCKAFIWSPKTKQAIDVTARNRGGIDARDPGGRLGPFLEGGAPDTRNLKVFFELCREGDIVLCMSDGVHDNFDPKSLGYEPSDFGLQGTWEDLPPKVVEDIKLKFHAQKISEVLRNCTTARECIDTLIDYSFQVTRKSREYMEAHPKAKQPPDYKAYPGKMDHTTCVATVVGVKADD